LLGGRERGKNVDLIRTRGFRGRINCSVFTPLYKEGRGPVIFRAHLISFVIFGFSLLFSRLQFSTLLPSSLRNLLKVFLMARTKQTAALIDEEPAMSGEEATFSQEGAMSIDGDGSEELLDSLPQGEIGARDPEDVSGRREPEVPEAVAGGGSGGHKAPEDVPVEKLSADDAEASVPVKGKNFEANRDYEIYIESAYAGDFGRKRFKSGVDAGSSAAEVEGTSGCGHSSKVSDARIRTPAVIDKTYRLNRSRVGEAELAVYVERGYFEAGRARCPGDEEIPQPKANKAVVFRDYFEAGLRLPALFILQRVLTAYGIQIHHLTPNAFVQLSKFIWAVRTFNAKVNYEAFLRFFSCHLQNKKVYYDNDVLLLQYGVYTFQPRSFSKKSKLEKVALVTASRNRWDNDWVDYWFYAEVPEGENDDGSSCYPLASSLVPAEPIFSPAFAGRGKTFQPCCDAFKKACKVISGRTVVEEFIAAGVWPVEGGWKPDGTEKVKLEERKFTYRRPKFNGLKRPEGLRPLQFVEMVEECANILCDPFSAAKAYDVENGLIPKRRINRIFDSLKISYGNHAVPLGRKRLKKGETPEITTTSYIKMRGWEKKAEPPAGGAGSSGSRAGRGEDESVAGGSRLIGSGNAPVSPGLEALSEGRDGVPVIELSDTEELLDGASSLRVDVEEMQGTEPGRSAMDMIEDDVLGSTGVERSGDAASSSASESSDGSSSSGDDSDSSSDVGSSYGTTKDASSLGVSLAVMSGLREYNPEELRATLEANSAPNLADLLLRQGQMITQASQVLRKKLETEVGFGGVPPELVALREEKNCWEAKEASFEEEIARLKKDLQEKTDSFAAYKKDSERKHAAALKKVEDRKAALEETMKAETERLRSKASALFRSYSELLARFGRQPRPLPAGDDLTLDSFLTWVERELQSVPSLVTNMCDHGAKTCLYALLDILAKRKVGDFHELGYSTFPCEAIEGADPNTSDKGVSVVAKRFWRFYWNKHGSAAASASAVSRAQEAKEKKRKEVGGPASSSNPSSADEQGKAKKAKSATVAEASSAAPRSATPSEPVAKVAASEDA
ncbi:hypothetical protein EJB05_02069, partial [Eragrostis curvula]